MKVVQLEQDNIRSIEQGVSPSVLHKRRIRPYREVTIQVLGTYIGALLYCGLVRFPNTNKLLCSSVGDLYHNFLSANNVMIRRTA